ncbi:MAG: oligosaccharide flippase family protein, partial [Candidatus Altiarchaeota archaeon]
MSSLDKIAKAGFIVFLGMGFERFFSYFFRVLVARAGVEVYGLYSLSMSLVLTLVSLSMLGLTDGLVRFVSFHAGRGNQEGVNRIVSSTLKVVLPVSIFFMLAVFLFSHNLSSFFSEPRLSLVLKFFSLLIPVMVLINVYSGVNVAYKRMEYVVFSKNIFAGVLRIILLLFFLYLGFSLTGVLIAHLLSFILALICLAYFTRRLITFTLVKGFDKELLSYSWPLMFTAVTLGLTERVDTLMIAYFRDTVDVALYNTAYPTAALMFIASTAILSIFFPTITGKYAKKQSIRGDYKSVTRWIFTINLPIAAIMIFYSRELLTFLFTREYIAASYALSLLGFVFFTESFIRPSIGVLMMLKKTKFILYIVILRFL